ncbi:endonuclease V [Candidatus Bathyarchaeota archaeon]|nr:MAG: endonuclease V [Candidatus Bathyarchaeota archaeon]
MDAVYLKPSFSIEKAHETQLKLSKQIILEDVLPRKIHFVAGVDVAYVEDLSIGAVAVLDYTSLKLVESKTAICKTRFPYVPTLLSFREISPTVLCIKKLHLQPDVFLIDGHGVAHPYRCGFASHLGVVIRKPTIGVAKGILFGEVEDTRAERNVVLLRNEDEVIGALVATKPEGKPVYVSTGHRVSLKTAIKIVRHCTRHSRIPEPILKAHQIAKAEKLKINITSAVNK